MQEALQRLIDRQEIQDLSIRYMRGQDRLDAALQRSVFADDAYIDYGFFQGGPDDFVKLAQGILAAMTSSHHLIGQMDVRLDGERAFGEIYYIAFHRLVQDGRETDLFVSGRYVDRYERRGREWKMTYRSEVIDWMREGSAADGEFMKSLPGAIRGARDLSDLSYRIETIASPRRS
jgi:hypothetical protein